MSQPTVFQDASGPEVIFVAVAFSLWIITAATTSFLLWKVKTVDQKRSVFRTGMLLTGGTFLLFICGMIVIAFPAETLFFMVPTIVVIGYLNLRFTHYCPKCLRQTQGKAEFCPHCGTKFNDRVERSPSTV